MVVVVILVRRGVLHPAQKARSIRRAMTTRYRQTFHGGSSGMDNPEYNGERPPPYSKKAKEGYATYDVSVYLYDI